MSNRTLLDQAWDLAKTVYNDPDDVRAFMHNPQPGCLGLMGTEDQFTSPRSLIQNRGQDGFDIVAGYLNKRQRVVEPA